MRLLLTVVLTAAVAALASASDAGTPPRPSSADYPVSRPAKSATIAAVLVTPDQVKRIFPAEVNKKYVIVEVAIYPETGKAVDIKSLDFGLKFGPDVVRYPATPQDIAAAWRQKSDPPSLSSPVNVTAESGVAYGTGTDPNTGQRTHGWSTYESVGVSTGKPSDAPPPPPGYDPNVIEAVARESATGGPDQRCRSGVSVLPPAREEAQRRRARTAIFEGRLVCHTPFAGKVAAS